MGPNILAAMRKPLCLFRYFLKSYHEKTDSLAQCETGGELRQLVSCARAISLIICTEDTCLFRDVLVLLLVAESLLARLRAILRVMVRNHWHNAITLLTLLLTRIRM